MLTKNDFDLGEEELDLLINLLTFQRKQGIFNEDVLKNADIESFNNMFDTDLIILRDKLVKWRVEKNNIEITSKEKDIIQSCLLIASAKLNSLLNSFK